MKLTYIDTYDFRRGDVIFMKARWYIDIFCRTFGISFPHVGVMLNEDKMIHINIDSDVEVVDILNVIYSESFEAWRPSGSTRSIRPARLRELLRDRYSPTVMLHNAIKMLGFARGKAPTYIGHSCTTFARAVLNAMGVATGAETPVDFEKCKTMPEWLDFWED